MSRDSSKVRGMQLNKEKGHHTIISAVIDEVTEETSWEKRGNSWPAGDLIDIEGDQDDWGTFETCSGNFPMNSVSSPSLEHPTVSDLNDTTSFTGISMTGGLLSFSGQKDQASSSAPRMSRNAFNAENSEHTDEANLHSVPLSKEEKAVEMARRKEERKQRIALLKQQKKNATGS